MNKSDKIFIAGHRGLVGSSILKNLRSNGYENLVLKTRSELDLRDSTQVNSFFNIEKPDYVFLAAAKVGGIVANNTYPAEFIYENLQIQNNVIHASYLSNVKRFLFLGSSCIYPKMAPQPLKEEYLLTGLLESTNRPYALAKIAGIEMCWAYNRQYGTKFLAAMPTNLYGPNDNYHLQNSHVIPALIRKFHEAKISGLNSVEIWGTGTPMREFLYSEDMADACVMLMNSSDLVFDKLVDAATCPLINVGCGEDISIKDLALAIKSVVGFEGNLVFDSTKPDGTPRKLMDVSKLYSLGWKPTTGLLAGLQKAYEAFLFNQK